MSKKVKVLIEIDEEVYKSVENETYCGSLYSELRNGTQITEGDLISRKTLKEEISDDDCYSYSGSFIKDLIDNAPSIGGNQNE